MMMIHVIIIIIIDYDHGDSDFEGYVWRRKRHCRHPLTELQVDQRMKMMIIIIIISVVFVICIIDFN